MIDKDPTTWGTSTWILVLGAGLASGLVSWLIKVKRGQARAWHVLELIGELFVSSVITLGVYMALESYYPVGVCVAVAGGCGHMGTRFFFLFETMLESKMKVISGASENENDKVI